MGKQQQIEDKFKQVTAAIAAARLRGDDDGALMAEAVAVAKRMTPAVASMSDALHCQVINAMIPMMHGGVEP
jgi:hypothetical protein